MPPVIRFLSGGRHRADLMVIGFVELLLKTRINRDRGEERASCCCGFAAHLIVNAILLTQPRWQHKPRYRAQFRLLLDQSSSCGLPFNYPALATCCSI